MTATSTTTIDPPALLAPLAAPLPAVDFARLGPPAGSRLLVAGGCGGIGRGLVAAALDTGLEVAVMDLAATAERHQPPGGAAFYPLDATDEVSVQAAFASLTERWDGIDAVVNLIGYANAAIPLTEVEADGWDDVLNGNVALRLFCREIRDAAVKGTRRRNGAHVLGTRISRHGGIRPLHGEQGGGGRHDQDARL